MTVSLYSFVGMYSKALDTAAHLLTKGGAFAKANGVSEADMLQWRLIEDMNPLSFQFATVCGFARQWTARAVDQPTAPEDFPAFTDVAGGKAAIAEAKAYLASLTPEQFAGRDDVPMTVTLGTGMEPTLPTSQWITGFATTNIFFHLSTAYGILRSKGVKIGKVDLFAGGL